MGMCPEEMERWGTASIFKESARLLRKHYRLYLPFLLAFYMPRSIGPVLYDAYLLLSSTPLPDASVVEGTVYTVQTTNPPGDQSFTTLTIRLTIFSWPILLLISVLGTLGTGAVSYITAYLYNPTETDDDRSIVPKVFKFLPYAFLRMFITRLWTVLAFVFLYFFSIFIAVILVIILATGGWSDDNSEFFARFALFALFPFFAGIIILTIVFALAQVIAVLEPGNYGRSALTRSMKLARIGRVWTIVAVTLIWIVLYAVSMVLAPGTMTGGMPVWAEIVVGVVIGGVDSVFRVYFGVVSVVIYFVYKARFDAAESLGIPVFKRIDSAEHSYDPIVEGKGSVTYIAKP